MPRLLSSQRAEKFSEALVALSEQALNMDYDPAAVDIAELRIGVQACRRLVGRLEELLDIPVGP